MHVVHSSVCATHPFLIESFPTSFQLGEGNDRSGNKLKETFLRETKSIEYLKKKAENPFQYEYNEIGFIMAVVESIHSLHCTNIFFSHTSTS